MSNYVIAESIYEDARDLDYMDYEDTREQSISEIMASIDRIGEGATRALFSIY